MKPAIAVPVVIGLVVALATAAQAEEKPPATYAYTTGEDNYLVVGRSYRIDAAFAKKREKTLKAPFRFTAPTGKGFLIADQRTEGANNVVKIAYATPDKKFIENFQFSSLTVPLGPETERLDTTAALMAKDVFAMATRSYKDPVRDGVRRIEVGGRAAIEVFGRYIDPANGVMYLRIVGIPHPGSPHGVFMVANISRARLPLDNPDQLATRTRSGAALKTFKYLE